MNNSSNLARTKRVHASVQVGQPATSRGSVGMSSPCLLGLSFSSDAVGSTLRCSHLSRFCYACATDRQTTCPFPYLVRCALRRTRRASLTPAHADSLHYVRCGVATRVERAVPRDTSVTPCPCFGQIVHVRQVPSESTVLHDGFMRSGFRDDFLGSRTEALS